ncbi:inorganic phosphate transporter [Telmatobacter bradus]|uniref:inorganic phosphate transporter n=1 Tax=Telmatobacter bradus TaxID=474953 RepID=UPI003B439CF2
MADLATAVDVLPAGKSLLDSRVNSSTSRTGMVAFMAAVLGGIGYICFHVAKDLDHTALPSIWPYLLLALALLIALGFEFVNGFHDTANAVATVIYTHSLEPHIAVVFSGLFNLLGVLLSTGTVAYAIITLLPVELILQVSSGAGFSMVFALLIAAILWNLATWYMGLPASSSHTMVGSIMGVGLANQLLNGRTGTSGVDWEQGAKVLKALVVSPVVGFCFAALLLLFSKASVHSGWRRLTACLALALGSGTLAWSLSASSFVIAVVAVLAFGATWLVGLWLANYPAIFQAPRGQEPPPLPIRLLMILTCGGVSYAHGSNDGQKGMGLIMLILIGTVPTAYALNHAVTASDVQSFLVASEQVGQILDRHVDAKGVLGSDPRSEVTDYIRTKQLQPDTILALRELVRDVDHEVSLYGAYKRVPAQDQTNVRNDMYVASEALRLMEKSHNPAFTPVETGVLKDYGAKLDKSTKFIPDWVKVAVALALGLGTMVGWKRIVVTVGEKIGKENLTYAQGVSAGLVAMSTILAADRFGLPVSTTHVLSSGVAGTMAADGSGIRFSTVRNIVTGWVLTLPAAALLSGLLYWLFHSLS